MHNKTNPPGTFKYIPSFDGLRGIAIILVLLLHGSYGIFKGGWMGVDIFFVLSGYLITSLLQVEWYKSGRISFKKFYIRRALRLYPALLLGIILITFVAFFTDEVGKSDRLLGATYSLFYMVNIISFADIGDLFRYLWTLAVEEHFYFIWPIVVTTSIFILPFKNRIWYILFVVAIVSAFRILAYNNYDQLIKGFFVIDYYSSTLCRVDNILLGCALSIYKFNRPEKFDGLLNGKLVYLIVFIQFLGILMFVESRNYYWAKGGFIVTNMVSVLMVIYAIKNPAQKYLSGGLLKWFGQRSYGIYIYHYPIFHFFETYRKPHDIQNFIWVFLLRLAVSLIVADLSYRYFEKPILTNKRRFQIN